jgi:N-acetyl-alpha-D-glucosaminyl L-malate synthase BshA
VRVGIMCHSSLGGSGRIGAELALELSRRGHRVHLFSRGAPFVGLGPPHRVAWHGVLRQPEEAAPASRLRVDWPAWETQTLLRRLVRVIDTEGLDLLHFHYALPFAGIAGEIKRSRRCPPLVVGTLHGTDVSLYGRHPGTGPQLARELLHLDGLTTVSVSHAWLAGEVFGLAELPRVIPNFVDLGRFRPPAPPGRRRPVGRKGRRRARLVHISNFRPVKNPFNLARIFAGLRERLEAELWLVGDGPEVEGLKSFFKGQGLERDVRFWGALRQVAPILAQADLLLMPSQAESFCLAALEAMACGVPVLASRVGGLPEVVLDGQTGLLFPAAEPEAAVELAVELLANPARHRAMREAAVRRARQFGQSRIVRAYESYYEGLLHRRGRWRPGTNGDPRAAAAAGFPARSTR